MKMLTGFSHSDRPAPPLAAAILALGLCCGATLAQGSAGSVAGTVRLTGPAPALKPVALASDHHCVRIAGHRPPPEEVLVGPNGGLANVFVRLEGKGLGAAAGPAPSEPVLVEQRDCVFLPHVVGARPGQTLRVTNQDEAFHNVRSVSEMGRDFNISQPFSGMKFDYQLTPDQGMLRLHCDVHPWMKAYVGVVDHPWFAVSGEDGRFEIRGVPPGTYDLVLWHERYGTLKGAVSIEAGGAATADFEYAADAGAAP